MYIFISYDIRQISDINLNNKTNNKTNIFKFQYFCIFNFRSFKIRALF